MSVDETPQIKNFQRLVQYARPGKILVTGGGTPGNIYPEWSEGTAGSGSIVAFNGSTFVAMTVGEAAVAAGEVFASGSLTLAMLDPRYINASGDVMEGHLFQPLAPTASGHLVNKAYADALPSGSDANFLHTQAVASAAWVVVHGLGKYPSTTILDSSDNQVYADVHHDSINQVTVTFLVPETGKASFN